MTSDPTGLFQRIPELEPLCQERRIRQAVEGGDPFKLYRALWWAKTLNRLPEHRATLQLLLSQRRLFARPLKKAPSLRTFNSIGTTILGSSEPNPDGTYVATHFIVVLFAIPLLPLGAYLVAKGQKARSYSFFARVPLGSMQWAWSRFWALAVVAAVAIGAVRAGYSVGHHELQIVNAFDKPVQVQIGAQTATVPANGRLPLTLPVGKYKGQARVAGVAAPIDEADLNVVSDNGLLIWNLAGAAPVIEQSIVYSADEKTKAVAPKPTVLCGQRYLALRHVDDAFSEPPKEVEMSEGETQVTRTYVDVIGSKKDANSKIDSAICFGWLASQKQLPQALEVQTATARVEGWPASIATSLLAMQAVSDATLAEKLAREASAARPDDIEVQRAAQDARISAGHEAELIAEYKKRAAASPDSASAQYLYARLLDGPEGLAATELLLRRFPKDTALLRMAVYERNAAGEWAASDLAWQSLRALVPAEAVGELDIDAQDLVALGKAKEAQARVDQAFPGLEKESADQQEVAELHARLALLAGERDPDKLLLETETQEAPATLARARLGLPVAPEQESSPVLQLVQGARTNPSVALSASTQLELLDIFALDPTSWALAYAEAARTGNEPAQKVLGRYFPDRSTSKLERLRRFVRGENVTLPLGLVEPAIRNAALFVRSRNASLAAKERAALLAQARHLDCLHTSISSAIDSWPQPLAAR